MNSIDKFIIDRANTWLQGDYDDNTKQEIKLMMENSPENLTDSFYRDLEFGTGGLRGIMGAGSNRMNKYTVGMATQGFANFLKNEYQNIKQISVAIAYDCRNNNTFFAETTANVLTGNGIKVYLFDDLRPTPELSFAVRYLKCQGGIVITASHNPKEYNGYKVYGDDGAQLVSPQDKMVMEEVSRINSLSDVKFADNKNLLSYIGSEIDEIYIQKIKDESLNPEIINKHKDLKIVYTPIHGTGVKLIPAALKKFGFENIISVKEQNVVDGNFPTVHSPNPEESEALKMAISKAKETDAILVMASDPDADRVGIAVRDRNNNFVLLNGNQTASVLFYYILSQYKDKGKLHGNEFIVKTVVTSEILIDIANSFGIDYYDVLTGFKFIANVIKLEEGKKKFIVGGEESYGYLIGDFVRDKDAVSACCFIAETAAWAAENGKSIYDIMEEIYTKYGFYYETLKSVVRQGKSGAEEIQDMMDNYRSNTPQKIAGSKVVMVKDYLLQINKNILTLESTPIELPKSNVLQFFCENGSKITVRPSGTEPKIKFYFGVKGQLNAGDDFDSKTNELKNQVDKIISDLKL
ncbi:MAG: phosphoglucomutase [Bacteroidetes bacterium CG2_30_33_31]|nr:MAG: phosphoglucomutase [Bacteroidetes bacterium CG2_30_33_31]